MQRTLEPMEQVYESFKPLFVFGGSWLLCGVAGLAALLRSDKQLTKRLVFSAFLNSSIFGLITGMAMWCWKGSPDLGLYDVVFIMMVSGFAGIGGVDLVIFVFNTLKKSSKAWLLDRLGVKIPENPTENQPEQPHEEPGE